MPSPEQEERIHVARQAQLGNYRPAPFVLTQGKGCRVQDLSGREYLDLSGGIAVLSLGHTHPDLVSAIGDQAARLMHVSNIFYNDRAIELAEALVERTAYDKVYFANSGTEANEALLKLARRYHYAQGDKTRVELVSTHNSFHGRTMGALSLTGRAQYHEGVAPLMGGVRFVDFNDIAALEQAVGEKTAAVILEPIQAEGGIFLATQEYLQAARRICDEKGALLLLDEIQTGYGRTGKFLAQEWANVEADACSLAKGMGGGFPIGAILVKEKFADALSPGTHGSTFGGNPLACAAGLAVLNVIDKDGLVARAAEFGEWLEPQLQAMAVEYSAVELARGKGLLWALKLHEDVDPGATLAKIHAQGLLLTLAGGNALRISPALTVTEQELEEGLKTIGKVLDQAPRKAR